jgi:hypothetical protein
MATQSTMATLAKSGRQHQQRFVELYFLAVVRFDARVAQPFHEAAAGVC